MRRDDELARAGWERRFIACEPRLSEMAAMYQEIGLDVHLEPLPAEEGEAEERGLSCADRECTACFDADRDRYRIIFTRPRADS
ncbi:MAG TPA: hypothetical protein VMT62_06405 [Syntrophorhabdaceae bacterium]|nr:hypothetical protein [Syntrophorhabdaceae bacterium]